MVKTVIVQQIVDEKNVYKVGDKVRIKMKPNREDKPERYSEHIGEILQIANGYVTLGIQQDTKKICVRKIDKIRFAKHHETFLDKWN